jgi:putative nucleotidyltransferase with HDIG domain
LVDDDDLFRPVIESELKESGFDTVASAGAEDAIKKLSSETFDVVVSDIQMPGMNGLALLEWIKSNRPLPVILMTGFMELAETLQAAKAGATGFLAKPFKPEDLIAALVSCFPSSEAAGEPGRDMDTDYCKVAIEDFVSGSDSKYDIYVRLSAAKYVKIADCGQDVTMEKIKTFKANGIHSLYLTRPDFRSYAKFNLELSRRVAQSPKLPREKKLHLIKHAAETLSACTFAETIDLESVEDAKSVVEMAVSVLVDLDNPAGALYQLQSHADYVYAHCVAVSFVSTLIAKQMGWTSTPTLLKLATGALFHDIGKKELPRELLYKARKSHTPEEAAAYETHCQRGQKALSALSELPEDVAQIALEHHENAVGFGFPGRKKRDKVHPLARVVAVADEFCKHALPSPDGAGLPPHQALGRLTTFNSEIYDVNALVALMGVLKTPIPERFAEEIQWRQKQKAS